MKIVGFGDYLIHFSPPENDRFLQGDTMRISFTGAEANVCAALSFWGEKVDFITRLPRHMLSRKGLMFMNSFRVSTDYVAYGEGRMGTYFLEKGHSVRPSSVIYDRLGTVFTASRYEDFAWEEILEDADALYLSGITPSLSEELFQCCRRLLAECKHRGIAVFYDVNLRPAICDITRSREIFFALAPAITHVISNEEHMKQLLGMDGESGENPDRLPVFAELVREKTGIANVAITVRRTINAHQTRIYGAYSTPELFAASRQWELDVVDRVGSGDAFSAGIIYGISRGWNAQETVEFAAASSAVKHTINNDINFAEAEEIKSIASRKTADVRR